MNILASTLLLCLLIVEASNFENESHESNIISEREKLPDTVDTAVVPAQNNLRRFPNKRVCEY